MSALSIGFLRSLETGISRIENDFDKRELLIAAGVHCCRMRTAAISPGRMLEELTAAIHILKSERPFQPQPIKSRPALRVIEGGLSRLAS
jgi:hypothetical protein